MLFVMINCLIEKKETVKDIEVNPRKVESDVATEILVRAKWRCKET